MSEGLCLPNGIQGQAASKPSLSGQTRGGGTEILSLMTVTKRGKAKVNFEVQEGFRRNGPAAQGKQW